MRTDWQAYEDGVLTPMEKAAADELMRKDPSARRELEGLRALRKAVRAAALREPVPMKKLNLALAATTGGDRRQVGILRPALLVLALLAVIAFALFRLYAEIPTTYNDPVTKSERFTSQIAAQTWAHDVTGIEFDPFDLSPMGKIVGAHTVGASACFDFEIEGGLVHVAVANTHFGAKGCKTVPTDDGNIFLHEVSGTVYVNCGEFGYIISGGSAETGLAIGKFLLENCANGGQ
jgi:hypothetical protein